MIPTRELQQILRQLGYTIPDGEFADAVAGPGTRAALQLFQRLHGLEVSDEPDERTLGPLHAAAQQQECVVFGQVVDAVGPVVEARVTVQDRELDGPPWTLLGEAPTDADGHFKVFYTSEQVLPGDKNVGPPRLAI